MKKLLILLLLPLFSFSQLTLETMSNIDDSQSFKRAMIENGFQIREDGTGDEKSIEYKKMGVGEIPEILAYYMMRDEDDILFDEKMMFIYTSDYKGESESHKAIYDRVKSECEFVDVRDYNSTDVAFYKCRYENPSKELLELQAYFEKNLPNSPDVNILNYEVGFNKSESLHLIHFPTPNKSNSSVVQMIKKVIEMKKSGELDELIKEQDSVN